MVRVRFYGIVLSLPLALVLLSFVAAIVADFPIEPGYNFATLTFFGGVLLQFLFSLVFACPRCGKSPYAIGPSVGPFAFAGKPIPDLKCGRCGFDLAEGKDLPDKRLR